jgi:branched-chain amino acid transport system ATP-binding protein
MEKPDQKYALSVTEVSKSFGGVHAVRNASLYVLPGERRALIGPNGAGKTTLFNLIAGELSNDSGKVEIFGIDISKKSVHQRAQLGLGRTYQISQLFLEMTVEQNLFLASAANKKIEFHFFKLWRDYSDVRDWVKDVAEQVKLSDYLNTKVSEISHGLQRQLEIGMAIAMRPRLIMLDEPAAGLSPSERLVLTGLIKTLPKEVTLVLIEHDMEIVLDIADQITVLNHGSVIAEGTPVQIKANQEVQKVYLGSTYA